MKLWSKPSNYLRLYGKHLNLFNIIKKQLKKKLYKYIL